jgi:hypothetical protein
MRYFLALLVALFVLALGAQADQPFESSLRGAYVSAYVGADPNADQHGGIQVTIPTTLRGILLKAVTNDTATDHVCRITSTTTAADSVEVPETAIGGGASQLSSVQRVYTKVDLTDPNGMMHVEANTDLAFDDPMFVPGGKFFACWEISLDTLFTGSVTYKELRP